MKKSLVKLLSLVLAAALLLQLPGLTDLFGLLDTPGAKATAAAAPNDMAGEPSAKDMQPEDETGLTPELIRLADSLSIVGIYEYVRGSIKSEFYYGPSKGAAGAYEEQGGNDYDTAALLIGMLRHKGAAARYGKGIVSLTVPQAQGLTGTSTADEAAKALAAGGNPTTVVTSAGRAVAIRIERVWAECYIAYGNYRGTGPNTGEKSWIPLDGGYKQLDGAGAIIREAPGLLPPALPYEVVNRLGSFSTTAGQDYSVGPEIEYDIPFRMALGEKYECYVSASGKSPIQSLTVLQNGAPVALSPMGAFIFEAKEQGTYIFAIEAKDADGSKATITHTLVVVEEADMTPPELEVELDPGEGRAGSPVRVTVTATDDSGTAIVTVTVNGEQITGEGNVYTFVPDEADDYVIMVTATDPSGNYTRKGATYTLAGGGYTIPQLEVELDMSQCFEPGDPIYIYVTATDESGEAEASVMADGEMLGKDGDCYIFRPDRYGIFEIVATATNAQGSSAHKTISVALVEGGGQLDITPPELEVEVDTGGATKAGKPITVRVRASDDSGAVDIDVKVNGAALTGDLGTYSFTPDEDGAYSIVATATDSSGNYAKREISVPVPSGGGGGAAPSYPSLKVYYPEKTIYVGETMRITVEASDDSGEVQISATANGEPLPYDEEEGTALFAPLEPGNYEILVTAENPSGNTAYSRFSVSAAVNTEEPHLFIVVNNGYDTVDIGGRVRVKAGGVGVSGNIALTVDGEALELDAYGEAELTAAHTGIYTFVATAKSALGGTLRAEAVLKVYDPDSGDAPTAAIISPADGVEITAPVEVIGSVGGEGLAYYTLSYAPAGSSEYTEIAKGGQAVENAALGVFDPTMLNNGYYSIRLAAYGAVAVYDEVTVNVQGEMKVGNFSIAFQDMVFPVSNFPLTVSRSYDSRDRQRQGDFGFGWSLGLSGATLSASCVLGENWSQTATSGLLGLPRYSLAEDKPHEVTVDWGNGRKDTFAMRLSPAYQDVTPIMYGISVTFAPTGNTRSRLAAEGAAGDLLFLGGRLVDYSSFMTYNPTRFRLTAEDGTVYVISAASGVESIADTLGNTITINRNGVYHSDGKSIAFVRDSRNRITKIIGPTEKEVSYRYNESGDLAEVIDAGGESVRFTYDRSHYLTDILDPRGVRAARNEYDDSGRLVAVVDAGGNRMAFDNDVSGRRQAVTDRLGNTTLFVYDERGNILSRTDALGNTTYNGYDGNGNLSSQTDALGNITRYEYSPDGNMLAMTNALGIKIENTYNQKNELLTINAFGVLQGAFSYNSYGQTTQTADALGHATRYEYQSNGLPRSISDDIGLVMQFTYDSSGNVVSITDGVNETALFTYDADGNALTRTVTRKNSNGANDTLTESYQYDIYGNVTKTIYPDGTFISSEYDAVGNMTAVTDSAGRRTTLEYDVFCNLTKVSYYDSTFETFEYDLEGRNTKATDRNGQTISMTYDSAGNMRTKTYTNGYFESYEYDDSYRLASVTDAAGATTAYEYDAIDRNTAIEDALGNRTEFSYNSMSQLSEVKDPRGYVTRYEYDLNGNRTRAALPDGSAIAAAYDARGRLITQTDQNGYATHYEYDGLDRLTGVTDALGNSWAYTYNSVNELIAVTDPNGNRTSYKYDGQGRIATITDAAGHESGNVYDGRGNLASSVDFNGVTTTYRYDSGDRLDQVKAGGKTIEFAYNANSQIESVTDENGVTRYTYNSINLMTSERKPDGRTLSYEYDIAGRLTRLSTPYGNTGYAYDLLGRLETVTDKDGGVTSYEYDPNGNLISMAYPNGLVTEYAYSPVNALIWERVTDSGGAVLREYAYTVGKTGERLMAAESGNRTVAYEYDRLYRLTKETVTENASAVTTSYAYDAAGNRISKAEGGAVTEYAYNSLNQLISETGIAYEYDQNGNRIKKTEGLRTTTYAYDEMDSLIRVTVQEGQDVAVEEYKYDWQGNRIEKSGEMDTARYLVDANNWISHVVAETDGGAALKAFYTRGSDMLIHMDRGGARSYYLYDGHGSVRMLADEGGAVTDTYTFDAYGELASRTGVTENDYLYAGERYDWLTQMYYLRARYMDPSTGTFISMDTHQGNLYDPVSLHKYMYANADPVNNTDPTGLFSMGDISVSMSISSTLNSVAMVNFVSILQWVRITLGVAGLVFAARDFIIAYQTGDYLGMVIALANGIVSIANIFSVCKLDMLTRILSKCLAGIALPGNVKAFANAVEAGDTEGALIAGVNIILDIVTIFSTCFTGDTLVYAAGGYVRIDEIQAGDYVWAYNAETGGKELKEVLQVYARRNDVILHLETSSGDIDTTTSHPFYVIGKGWVAAGDLAVGDEILTYSGDLCVVTGLFIERLAVPITVYNLQVEGFHTYYVGTSSVLVHNTCQPGSAKQYSEHSSRNSAFRAAKRNAGIPMGQQPTSVSHVRDYYSNQIVGREYSFGNVTISQHGAGHILGDIGPHFNIYINGVSTKMHYLYP